MAEPGRLDLVQRRHAHARRPAAPDRRGRDRRVQQRRARVVRAMTRVVDRTPLHAAIDGLVPEASTNLEDGLTSATRWRATASGRARRTASSCSPTAWRTPAARRADQILAQVREEAAKQIALLGVGVGSSYGDALMERLADGGDGFVVYVSEPAQARDVFVRRLPATLAVRALDAKVQVVVRPEDRDVVPADRLREPRRRRQPVPRRPGRRRRGRARAQRHRAVRGAPGRRAPRGDAEAAQVDVRWLDPTTRAARRGVAHGARSSDLDGAFASAGAAAVASTTRRPTWPSRCARTGERGDPVALDVVPDRAVRGQRTGDRAVTELATLIERTIALRR